MDRVDEVKLPDIDKVRHFVLDIPEYPDCKKA